MDVEYYADGKIQLLELCIKEQSNVINKCLKELKLDCPFLILAIKRDEQLIIPAGEDRILPNDIIFLLAKTEEMVHLEQLLGIERLEPRGSWF